MTMESWLYIVVLLAKLAQTELPTDDLQVVHDDKEVFGLYAKHSLPILAET